MTINKNTKFILAIILGFFLIPMSVFFISISSVKAADCTTTSCPANQYCATSGICTDCSKGGSNTDFGCFEVGIPGISNHTINGYISQNQTTAMVNFAKVIVDLITAIIVTISLISTVVAGYIYMTAGGDAGRVALSKTIIIAGLTGILLSLCSYLILNTISPQFTSDVKDPQLRPISTP